MLPADAIAVPDLPSHEILDFVDSAPWFSSVGRCKDSHACSGLLLEYLKRCGVPQSEFRWIGDWDEASRIAKNLNADRAFWKEEQSHRSRALEGIQSLGRQRQLQDSLHQLSIIGYEKVRPEIEDEELARVAAGAGLWTASLSLVWATAADALAPEPNPFLPKLEVFRMGNWPLGFEQGSFVIL